MSVLAGARAWFAANRTTALAGGAVLAGGAAYVARKRGAGAALPAARPAGVVVNPDDPQGIQGTRGSGGYDSTVYDVYNALQPNIEALERRIDELGAKAPAPAASAPATVTPAAPAPARWDTHKPVPGLPGKAPGKPKPKPPARVSVPTKPHKPKPPPAPTKKAAPRPKPKPPVHRPAAPKPVKRRMSITPVRAKKSPTPAKKKPTPVRRPGTPMRAL